MFSRKNIMQTQSLDLREIVGNMSKLLGRLLGETIALKFQSPPELPTVQGDSGMIEQVVLNLAVNSRDAMPRGGTLTIEIEPVTVDAERAEKRPDARTGYFLRLRVTDTGIGMDSATAEPDLRAVFHHQGSRQRHRPRAGDRLWHRQAA